MSSNDFYDTNYTIKDDTLDLDTLLGNLTIGGTANYNMNSTYGTINITGATGSVLTSPYNITQTSPYNITQGTYSINNSYTNINPSVKLGQDGIQVESDADIKLGDVSLKEFIKSIQERLAILTTNPKLEGEWEELKELGDRYRELEQQIKDKMKTWDILKRED